jgi:mono/diheme cytochrome c family protein
VILGRHLPAATTELIVRHGQNGMPSFRQSEFTDAELAALALWLQDSKPPFNPEKIP